MAGRPWGSEIQSAEEQFILKRRIVLDLAARTFSARGYDQTTLADIAADLGIAKPTIYKYFENKDEILYEIQRTAIASLKIEELDARRAEAPEEQIAMFLRRYVRMITTDHGACISTTPMQALKPETRAKLSSAAKDVDRRLRAIIENGIERGTFVRSDVKMTAAFIFGVLNWIPRWRPTEGPPSMEELEEAVVSHVLGSLMAR